MTELIDRWEHLKDTMPTDHSRAAELMFDLCDDMADHIESLGEQLVKSIAEQRKGEVTRLRAERDEARRAFLAMFNAMPPGTEVDADCTMLCRVLDAARELASDSKPAKD